MNFETPPPPAPKLISEGENLAVGFSYMLLPSVQVSFKSVLTGSGSSLVRHIDSAGNITTSFVCAKTRDAPMKAINIHRLELLGATLLAKLINRIVTDLKFDNANVFCFCDSKITLSWINHPIEHLMQFVSNRVKTITSIICKDRWFYIDTKNNPADLATRGISAETLL